MEKKETHVFSTSLFLARKNLLRNKKTTILTLFVISLGFISSIIIFGFINDVEYKMEKNYIDLFFGHIILEPATKGEKIDSVNTIIKKIETLPEVKGVAAVQKKAATITDKKNNSFSTEIWIVDPEDFARSTIFKDLLYHGEYLNQKSTNQIYIGCSNIKSCAVNKDLDNLETEVGDKIEVTFTTGEIFEPEVVGVYKHGLDVLDNLVLINEKTAQEIFSYYESDKADSILIRLPNRDVTKKKIEEISYLGVNADILSWEEKAITYTQTVRSFLIVGNLSFLIGVIISAITVYIVLYINALSKKIQIGIMRAIGIKAKIIQLSYSIQGFFYGLFGSLLGIILTFFMMTYFNIYPLQTTVAPLIPRVDYFIFILVSLTIIAASTLTGYIVSLKMSRKNILDLLLNF